MNIKKVEFCTEYLSLETESDVEQGVIHFTLREFGQKSETEGEFVFEEKGATGVVLTVEELYEIHQLIGEVLSHQARSI
ncbi:hypothetical protein [Psychrobacillus lasiicapitis]|uniref:Uncharacterized protein n=1 Tax=Psychrobacillus lasiicapitis TaxID=1636719 RepID=A0A544TA76_9BACI|nr:hypothetical protein [Psychrobacillus lasiicapitis]TQR14360.1 hypothetical protein FG382_07845 [Psychrobacillus lasiicapitis]GGA32020.1 hypothetical protein GCM10011384_21990 [Psychrobacillus lasiicapitis]